MGVGNANRLDAHRAAALARDDRVTMTGMYNAVETLRSGKTLTSGIAAEATVELPPWPSTAIEQRAARAAAPRLACAHGRSPEVPRGSPSTGQTGRVAAALWSNRRSPAPLAVLFSIMLHLLSI